MTCSYFRKLLADATPLPWVSSSDGDPYIDATSAEAKAWFGDPGASVVAESSYVANKKLIMAAINALPALLRVVEAAEELRDINATTSPALRQARKEMLDAALAAMRGVQP